METASEKLNFIHKNKNLPSHPVLVTFDQQNHDT